MQDLVDHFFDLASFRPASAQSRPKATSRRFRLGAGVA
jgi:hypothetical protein